jgi:hypothetical protein
VAVSGLSVSVAPHDRWKWPNYSYSREPNSAQEIMAPNPLARLGNSIMGARANEGRYHEETAPNVPRTDKCAFRQSNAEFSK